MKKKILIQMGTLFFICFLFLFSSTFGGTIEFTKHNLSASGPGQTKANSVQKMCVFCHTPHGGNETVFPLWNRSLNEVDTYNPYSSGSLDASVGQPRGYSKLCLSCHDGTFAIGGVINSPGSGFGTGIQMTETASDGTMRYGATNKVVDQFSGDTRRLGLDLSNDHPISFVFDMSLYRTDQELIDPRKIGFGSTGNPLKNSQKPVALYPLDFTGKNVAIQCSSCHNPHGEQYGPKPTDIYPKFLRTNIYNDYPNPGEEQICVACHIKPGWTGSTHEISNLTYRANVPGVAADGLTVAQHGCLNCHDPHTTQGADRLHRNGASQADGTGSPSIENTCFQCHISQSQKVPTLNNDTEDRFVPGIPPDKEIKPEFDKRTAAGGSAMPLNTNWNAQYAPNASNGIHEPVFVSSLTLSREETLFNPENPAKFTFTGPHNVHVECVDCHNPHQVRNPNDLVSLPFDRTPATNGGRLEGIKGIMLNGTEVGFNTVEVGGNDTRDPYVYEVCFRCHGDTHDTVMPFPFNGTSQYLRPPSNTNKRFEFDPDSFDIVYGPPTGIGTNNNSAYHPVAVPGRNTSSALCDQLQPAFDPSDAWDCKNNHKTILSSLTILCTDCHNNEKTGWKYQGVEGAGVNGPVTESNLRVLSDVPSRYTGTAAVGPHGSLVPTPQVVINGFNGFAQDNGDRSILRGYFFTGPFPQTESPFRRDYLYLPPSVTAFQKRFELCFNCHDWRTFYGWGGDDNFNSNFYVDEPENYMVISLHALHLAGNWNNPFGDFEWAAAEACMMCHYNVHSNVQATNTQYTATKRYAGGGRCLDIVGTLPPDEKTHLINFAPDIITPLCNPKPAWFYSVTESTSAKRVMRCDLMCHDNVMLWTYSCNHRENDSGGTDTCCDCVGCCGS